MLHIEIIAFVKKAIKIRETLIENKVSKLDEMNTKKSIEGIKILITAYSYSSDSSASFFFLQHVEEIRSFLPGPKSIAYHALQSQLENLITRAQSVVNVPDKRH